MSPQLIGLAPYKDGVEAPTEPLWPQLIGLVGGETVGGSSLEATLRTKSTGDP